MSCEFEQVPGRLYPIELQYLPIAGAHVQLVRTSVVFVLLHNMYMYA